MLLKAFQIFLIFSLFLMIIPACSSEKKIISPTYMVLGTTANLTLIYNNQNPALILEKSVQLIKEKGKRLNRYDANSDVASFNLKQRKVQVSPELFEIIDFSKKMSVKTNGLFDITVLPLVEIWDFKKAIIPSQKQIDAAKQIVGSKYLNLKSSFVIEKEKPVRIDLGGIAKGFITDELLAYLKSEQIQAGIIDIGGDIYAYGKPWNIGIRDPKTKLPLYSLRVQEKCVVTSGDYERFFEKEGKIYSHIIDIRSGKPAEVISHSVTVIGADIKIALAMIKALFILGPEKAEEISKNFPDYAYFFIMPNQSVMKSKFFPYELKKIDS